MMDRNGYTWKTYKPWRPGESGRLTASQTGFHIGYCSCHGTVLRNESSSYRKQRCTAPDSHSCTLQYMHSQTHKQRADGRKLTWHAAGQINEQVKVGKAGLTKARVDVCPLKALIQVWHRSWAGTILAHVKHSVCICEGGGRRWCKLPMFFFPLEM